MLDPPHPCRLFDVLPSKPGDRSLGTFRVAHFSSLWPQISMNRLCTILGHVPERWAGWRGGSGREGGPDGSAGLGCYPSQ